jgi:hypothetical protein
MINGKKAKRFKAFGFCMRPCGLGCKKHPRSSRNARSHFTTLVGYEAEMIDSLTLVKENLCFPKQIRSSQKRIQSLKAFTLECFEKQFHQRISAGLI